MLPCRPSVGHFAGDFSTRPGSVVNRDSSEVTVLSITDHAHYGNLTSSCS